ncbi:MAG: mitochondrial fission ELM1 family protein [Kiritimatiellae bacterium]|nr:mitochondrial fission ELM1 family protein [Kiritimatiellia bacterium]
MKNALILTDGKAGHENQSKALARALGCEFSILPVKFRSPFAKALSYLLDRVSVRTMRLFEPLGSFEYGTAHPDIVIGTGSGTFYAAKALARKLGAKCAVVLYPRGYDIDSFDCILAPAFDHPPKARNIVEIPANLVAADTAFYAAGEKAFRERHSPQLGKRACAVIVGGPNKCSSMSADWMKTQMDRIFAATPDCEHWLTTSRRTPPDVEKVLESYPFDYALFYSKDHFNPIPAFVQLADVLYVTAESTGMLSEACTFGTAQVHALDNLNPGPSKFRDFIGLLVSAGHLDGNRKIDLSPIVASALAILEK